MRARRSVPLLISGMLAAGLAASAAAQTSPAPDEHGAEMQPAASAPLDADRATSTLAAHGFSNVATVVEGQRVFVTFENTRYRDLRRALREAAAQLLPTMAAGGELVLVPTVDGVPLGTARYTAAAGSSVAADSGSDADAPAPRASLSLAGLPDDLLSAPRASSSYGRVDVVVHPWLEASFGAYADPVRSRTGVAPELRIALRRGLHLSAQVLFTLHDNLATGESSVRPGLVTLSQTLRLPRNVFVHATAGAFTPNRYGADVHARAYSPSGRWFAGAELGQTGLTSFARGNWQHSAVESRTALVEVGWRDLQHGVGVQAMAGAFLTGQQGIRIDVVRQFGEVDLGWFVMASERGKNGGALLRIPLGVSRHPVPHALRLRTADAFRWEYRYNATRPSGRRFRVGEPLDEVIRRAL